MIKGQVPLRKWILKHPLTLWGIILILGGVWLGFYQMSVAPPINGRPLGVVKSLTGEVLSRYHLNPFWFKLKEKAPLFPKQWILTGAKSRVVIEIQGQLYEIPPNSSWILDDQNLKKLSILNQPKIINRSLASGQITQKIPNQLAPDKGQNAVETQLKFFNIQKINQVFLHKFNSHEIWPIFPKIQGAWIIGSKPLPFEWFNQNQTSKDFILEVFDGTRRLIVKKRLQSNRWFWTVNNLKPGDYSWCVRFPDMPKCPKLWPFRLLPALMPEKPQVGQKITLLPWEKLSFTWKNQAPLKLSLYQNEKGIEKTLSKETLSHEFDPFELHLSSNPEVWSVRYQDPRLPEYEYHWPVQISVSPELPVTFINTSPEITCEKGQWKCSKPILVKIKNPRWHYQWRVLEPANIELQVDHLNDTLLICPNGPVQKFSWELIAHENSTFKAQWMLPTIQPKINWQPSNIESYLVPGQKPIILGIWDWCPDLIVKWSVKDSQSYEIINGQIMAEKFYTFVDPDQNRSLEALEIGYYDRSYQPFNWNLSTPLIPLSPDPQPLPTENPTNTISWHLAKVEKVLNQGRKPWILLKWSSYPSFELYEIQIAHDENFQNIIVSEQSTVPLFQFIIPKKLNYFYWRIRGYQGSDWSPWSHSEKVSILTNHQ